MNSTSGEFLLSARWRLQGTLLYFGGGGTGVSDHRAHTEWQLTLSGVHSIMMEKLAQAGKGGGSRPHPFTIVTITYKVAVYAPAEWADALTLFHLYQYIVCTLCF